MTANSSANNPNSLGGRVIYCMATLCLVVAFLLTFMLNSATGTLEGFQFSTEFNHYFENDQYARLADALLHGQLTLDLPVFQELADLANPYDYDMRAVIVSESVPVFWDHAFYEGSYYCYFGVVPAVLLYMPYQLITGSWLSTPVALGIIGVLAIMAMSLLVRRLALRYFAGSVTTLSLLACLFVVFNGCNYIYLAFVARFYSVPILSSLLFTALGLWLWLKARRGNHSSLSVPCLALGSACMALNFGCRPQFMLACFLAFPIFKDEIFVSRRLFSKQSIWQTVAALLPFVIVISPLLWYNYARFGSVLDFGSSYNLTGFDMTEYHQRNLVTLIIMVKYLFQPLALSSAFPFIEPTSIAYLDLGYAPHEPFFGGIFIMKPVLIVAFAFPFLWRSLKKRGLWGFSWLCVLFTVTVLFADTRTAGITERYFSDFGLYISLVACFVILTLQMRGIAKRPAVRVIFIALFICAVIFTLVLGTLELVSPLRYDSIADSNPVLYEQIVAFF